MSSCENVESTEVGSQGHQNHPPVMSNGNPKLNDNVEEAAVGEVEDEEDEEEDVDFNPFLKETPSPEASSSLSSEIEGLDTDVVDSRTNTRVVVDVTSSKIKTKVKNCDIVDADHGEEETVMQSTASPELQNTVPQKHNNWKPGSSSQAETEKESQLSSVNVGDSDNTSHSRKPVMHLDDVEEDAEDDAICRRTRARYSLASFSLDELEAFLQETDDEDDVHNVDDEEEYRKFLAAVLQGGDVDPQSTLENVNGEDEDEENDADFEIELEDALGSDYDEATLEKTRAEEYQRTARRPETRQNRRLKASAQYERKLSEQTKRPLRPLLPILPNGMTPIPTVSGNTWMSEMYKSCLPSAAVGGFINGFTSYQIGQLHCLIYEHVQLLIQIYSLCVLDYSRRQIASQIQGLIFEMLHKRDETIACKNEPFPDTCFKPPCFSASVPNTQMVGAQKISSSTGSHVNVSNGQLFSSWLPVLSSPVLSVLDVAPLNLVGKYMEDVYSAVQEHHQRHLENACVTQDEKEPLFPFHCVPAAMEANNEALRGSAPPTSYAVPSSINQPKPKKTLAATLVEKTKKQSVAVVPKKISKLAQRFFPLFNPALFPHKPPPAAVANRVLFTDAEDELLALGLMEYNSDWKAIHQRFLPCKSKHQIFVRQKNRCSSKAPENPIKAVRRMKTSPLTVEEIQGIQEGLKVFKLDWMSVWKFIVPHRDPSLLPRQWRIALGTQKSYKQDEAKKEKRRLYESERRKRKRKAADLSNLQHASDKEEYRAEYTGGENCTGDDDINKGDESYVHEGFLADWRPGTSELKSSDRLSLNISEKNLPENVWTEEGAHVRDQSNSYVSTVIKPMTGHMQGSPLALNHSQHPYTSHFASNALRQTHPVPSMTVNSSKSQVNLRPYRSRKTSNLRLVKLAPDLPPVNLPPSVRVIPESALKTNQLGAYTKISPILHSTKSLANTTDSSNPTSENVTNWCSEASRVVKDQSATEERSAQTDLQMHPLLFQAPEDGQVPYYRLNSGTGASSSFSFVTGNQPQLNLSLFYNPQQANHAIDGLTKTLKMKKSVSASCGIDFHPLLQRDDNTNSELVTANSTASHVSLDGKGAAPGISSAAVLVKSVIHCSPFATRSKPSGPNEKANGLDLEIHLSSSSTKENAALSTAMTRATNSSVSLLNSQNATETQDTPHTSTNNFVAGVHALSLPSKIIGRYMDDATDQTHPEIVMEQEELSDSDEEVEEHVEFECEEMADSEGEEGSDSEQVSEMQDKEALCLMTSKNVSDEDCNDDQCDLSTRGNSQTNICVLGRGSPPFLKLGLKCSKDKNSSWLSLDSSACGRISRSTSKNETSTMRKGPSAKVLASDRSNRPLKQATASTRKAAVKKHATDVAGQLSLSSLSVPTLRKPRKRTCRTNTIANAGSSLGNLNNNAKNSG